MGSPTDEAWPGWRELKYASSFANRKYAGNKLNEKIKLSEEGMDLLNKLLTLDPKKRISANKALTHKWFSISPTA